MKKIVNSMNLNRMRDKKSSKTLQRAKKQLKSHRHTHTRKKTWKQMFHHVILNLYSSINIAKGVRSFTSLKLL